MSYTPLRRSLVVVAIALAVGAACSRAPHPATAPEQATTHTVARGTLTVRAVYEGEIASRLAVPVSSRLNSAAVIMDVAAEGSRVSPGDVLVRFDASAMEQELIALERDATLARARLAELREADHPMELDALALQRDEAIAQLEHARRLLADTRELRAEDLVSEQEVEQQARDVARYTRQTEALDRQLTLTRDRRHPSALARAQAELEAAERTLAAMQEQLTYATVTATTEGLVVYQPLHVGGEFRTVRVGDTLYRNQPFLLVADMTDLVVTSYVPESEMAQVRVGLTAEVMPLAYPDLRLPATVDAIGSMAHTMAGRPIWQKFLRITLRLDETREPLRSGMTVRVDVITHRRESVILLPRRAVRWTGDATWCLVEGPGAAREAALTLGPADDLHVEVLSGVEPGDRVLLP